ncbi:adenosylcobinamide-GDP ribazoletransferase [Streptomyces avicenniae]|uniref:adenosylcobinamide-GDP ribazoletransferase n=1 Tax=Streptomyces avicenniae TaxID=500153 RepID=UPI000699325D|nr:adenosylcobinamide-GDP ribazoletransferase [Streptomyces avicenniae]
MNATPPPPPAGPPPATGTDARDALRFAFGTLTVLPVRPPGRWDRPTARRGMLCAPLAGLALGLAACLLSWLLLELEADALLTGVLAVALVAALSRGLHLDGLADVADGLGSRRPPEEALRVMKRSDIGPFGVLVLLLTVLTQVAAVAGLSGHGRARALTALVCAVVVSRAALTWVCRADAPPAARPDGMGATVARTVPTWAALAVAGAVALGSAVAGALAWGDRPAVGALGGLLSVLVALAAAELLLRHCARRLGGLTGDVLGACAETAATAALLVWTVTAP